MRKIAAYRNTVTNHVSRVFKNDLTGEYEIKVYWSNGVHCPDRDDSTTDGKRAVILAVQALTGSRDPILEE